MAAPTEPQSAANATAAPKRKRADTAPEPASKKARLGNSLNLPSQGEVAAADAIEGRYDVQLLSIISASKIQSRVTAVLRHIGGGGGATATTGGKPRVSVLRARAADASKLIAIAEIAKRELEKEKKKGKGKQAGDEEGDAGERQRWFQYIALGEEIKELPRKDKSKTKTKTKGAGAGAGTGKSIVEDTAMGDDDDEMDEDAEDDGEDDFETMKTPFERAIEGRPLLRGIPIMSLFLSRVSIAELKKRYGEQTNAPPR